MNRIIFLSNKLISRRFFLKKKKEENLIRPKKYKFLCYCVAFADSMCHLLKKQKTPVKKFKKIFRVPAKWKYINCVKQREIKLW